MNDEDAIIIPRDDLPRALAYTFEEMGLSWDEIDQYTDDELFDLIKARKPGIYEKAVLINPETGIRELALEGDLEDPDA